MSFFNSNPLGLLMIIFNSASLLSEHSDWCTTQTAPGINCLLIDEECGLQKLTIIIRDIAK